MQYKIDSEAQFPMVTYTLDSGESVRIQSGSMVYHTGDIDLKAHLNGGGSGLGKLIRAAGRSMTSGESFFMTEASARSNGSTLALAPNVPGTIQALTVDQTTQFYLNDGAFLAMDQGVEYTMERQSIGRALMGGQGGLFVMQTRGSGTLLISAFGTIKEIDLTDAKDFTIDNAHVVAWESTLNYDIRLAGNSFMGSIGTGEGLVNIFNGTGKVLIQSLNLETFASRLKSFLPTSSN